MLIQVNRYIKTTYELNKIPEDGFKNWSDDEIAGHFEKHGIAVKTDRGYCGYPNTPDEIIEW